MTDIKNFDIAIRTQEEFENLIASPTWLNAEAVAFFGDFGDSYFAVDSYGDGIKIPDNVKQIQGIDEPIIKVRNFVYSSINPAALFYDETPTGEDCFITNLSVECESEGYAVCYSNCNQLTNCFGNAISEEKGDVFVNCTNLNESCDGSACGADGHVIVNCT